MGNGNCHPEAGLVQGGVEEEAGGGWAVGGWRGLLGYGRALPASTITQRQKLRSLLTL